MSKEQVALTQADRDAANKAFDIAFRGDTDDIDDAMAELFAANRIAAEDNAWNEARELVRGTHADLCMGGAGQAYRLIHEGVTNAVNNPKLRTLVGRVESIAAAHESGFVTERDA